MSRAALARRIATPDGKRRHVRALFATIADRYDFITRALSYGQDARWKRRVIEMASPSSASRVLDLATGTGDLAFGCAARGARVVGLDLTQRMIELANAKAATQQDTIVPRYLVGDMLALPFPSGSFDIVTTGYGLRNVPDLSRAIDEIARVLKPNGQIVALDFNRPSNGLLRAVYLAYLDVVGASLGWILHRDPDTYQYIPASIRQYPGAIAVAEMMRSRGFSRTRYHPVLGGLMAIHHGIRD
ncbi:MAG TPA: ubiquinone/menaquinone biosynthesis methyltransferase [Vicinamibacterales bacterium]|jgi:demethylmenaquinone methyltransferase/2-methoxy-6-polyprenyl-1,4-benzoquinol methylase